MTIPYTKNYLYLSTHHKIIIECISRVRFSTHDVQSVLMSVMVLWQDGAQRWQADIR